MLSLFLNAKSPVPAYQYMPVRGVRMRRISEIFLYSLIVYSCEERNIAKALLFQTVTRTVYCFAKVPISSRNQHPPRLAILESTFAFSMPSVSKSVKIVFAFSQCCDILQNALLRPPVHTSLFASSHPALSSHAEFWCTDENGCPPERQTPHNGQPCCTNDEKTT